MTWSIVIVDDDNHVLDGIKAILSRSDLPCEVIGMASNGEEGLEMIINKQPDLIITDIYMPKMNGIEMIRSLREKKFQQKIIILSGYSEFKHAQQALKLKIEDYLSKPASRATIIQTVEGVLDQLEEQQRNQSNYQKYKMKVKQYEKYLTEELIESAIKGQLNFTSLQRNKQKIINEWAAHLYLPIRLSFSISNQNAQGYGHQLIHFAITNIIEDTMYDFDLGYYYIETDQINSILCLYVPESKKSFLSSQYSLIINKIKNNLSRILSIEINDEIGDFISTWQETISNIHKLLMSPADDNQSVEDIIEIRPIQRELSRTIQSTNIESIKKTLDNFFNQIMDNAYIPSIAMRIGIELWSTFKYELENTGVNTLDQFDQLSNPYQQFPQLHSWTELYDIFQKLVEALENEPIFQENIRHSKLIDDVLKYVEENLDKPITLNKISEELYISRNYLGRIFKEHMNISFTEYLTNTRINKARKLLLTGNYMIYEVADIVGFENPAYFSALFKKVLGYPPSQLLHKK